MSRWFIFFFLQMWHLYLCIIYSWWELGCYISGIRAGRSVRPSCWVSLVWQLNTVEVVCSLVRDMCGKHYQCFLVFLIFRLQDWEWDKWGRSLYFSRMLQVWSVGLVCRWLQDCKCCLDSVVLDSRGNPEVRFMSTKDLVLRGLCAQDARMLL